MGFPVSPIACNLYMEDFGRRVLESAMHPPRWWTRYIDDTHTHTHSTFEGPCTGVHRQPEQHKCRLQMGDRRGNYYSHRDEKENIGTRAE